MSYKKALQWRKENKIDTILVDRRDDLDELELTPLYELEGFDNVGRPILLVPITTWPWRKIALARKISTLSRCMLNFLQIIIP